VLSLVISGLSSFPISLHTKIPCFDFRRVDFIDEFLTFWCSLVARCDKTNRE
jgi:hypothetical protein